jgi:pyruvate dehydrogenase E1 component
MRNSAPTDARELEALETREWLESLDYVLQHGGPARVGRLLRELGVHATKQGVKLPFTANTPYINTIHTSEEVPYPGSREIERRIKSLVRWNAMAMVVRANRVEDGIGGHISTFASSARDTERPASTRVRFSRGASRSSSSKISVAS